MVYCYCSYPASSNDFREDRLEFPATPKQLVTTFKTIDPDMKMFFPFFKANGDRMWLLYDHKQYSYSVKGKIALAGNSAYPRCLTKAKVLLVLSRMETPSPPLIRGELSEVIF
uniref:WGS project CBMI000000000 data, contig CS3069_c002595 n=1 Tax=Fusarium clavum TaxID=2594811 RepID=A0A090N5R5_9HYPO|nr:unnamed protein product [Fusarium clavum]CEG05854.1 unnamed protein product [Fusarium clavum]